VLYCKKLTTENTEKKQYINKLKHIMPSPLCDLPVFSCFTPGYARNYTGEHRDSKSTQRSIFFFNCPSFSFHFLKILSLLGALCG
jgi:hypothetical protein